MKKHFFWAIVLLNMIYIYGNAQSKAEYTHWSLSHILHDYVGTPDNGLFIIGGPVVGRLDSLGGDLLFYLTPQRDHDCRQAFRIGWNFAQPVSDLEEGKGVNVEVFSYPVVDSNRMMRECYRASRESAGQSDGVWIQFIGGDTEGLASQPDLAFYWEKSTPVLFKVDQPIGAASGGGNEKNSGTMTVQDLDHDPSTAGIFFGTMALEIGMEGVFEFRILYLYDGRESDVSPEGAHRLLLDKLVVEHSVTGNSAAPVMNISLIGLLEQAVGRDVQIVIHFLDNYRRPLPGMEGDAAYCDSTGFAVASSPVRRVPSRQYYLNELMITVPYYALNLATTNASHTIYLYAEIFLDKKSIGLSRLTQTTFFW
jgi:hypothetical protein